MNETAPETGPAPMVSVVTPFYNTEAYLREAIESVLAQTWSRFEYILADNRSTDRSLDVVREYAARDLRVRLFEGDEHLPQIPNFNRALGHVSEESRYVKIVLADDRIYPECIQRMVEVAETDDRIGMVGSYYLKGDRILGAGLRSDRAVFEGAEVCRKQLLEGAFFFGSPTTLLFRADVVRERTPLFDAAALHADTELCYDLLRDWRFGFVHQVLSFLRVENESISSVVRHLNPTGLDKLIVLTKFGRDFLTPSEYHRCLERHERNYYRSYFRNLFGPNRPEFLRYHRDGRVRVGYRLSPWKVAAAGIRETANVVLNPLQTAGRIVERIRRGEDRGSRR